MKTKKTIAKEINIIFPPSDPENKIAFIRDDGTLVVSGEQFGIVTFIHDGRPVQTDVLVVDYYDEQCYTENAIPGVHKYLCEYIEKNGLEADWESAGAFVINAA